VQKHLCIAGVVVLTRKEQATLSSHPIYFYFVLAVDYRQGTIQESRLVVLPVQDSDAECGAKNDNTHYEEASQRWPCR
jgi:hypothetical protein